MVSLNNLIVRDIANQERGMYLISAATPPEMYELYAPSKEERRTWMSLIQQTAARSGQSYLSSLVVSTHLYLPVLTCTSQYSSVPPSTRVLTGLSTRLVFFIPKVSQQRRVSSY